MERARGVTEVLAAHAAGTEAAYELSAPVLEALHDARLFRLLLPHSLGGDALDPMTLARVTEVVATADASAAWCLGQAAGCAMSAAYLTPDVAQRVFGPRDAVLAWGAGAQGKAVAVECGFRVTGRWAFASGLHNATWLGGHSKVFEPDGSPRLRSDGRQLERTALFPLGKAQIHNVWQVTGLRGTGSDSYEVTDLFVPLEETIGRDDPSECRDAATIYRFPGSLVYAAAFGGVMLGISRGILTDLVELAGSKTPRGATSSMREAQVFQTDLARMEARWRAARAYHLTTLGDVWRAVDAGATFTLDQRISIRLAATHTINEGAEIVMQAYRAAGQTAIFAANPFERRLRDALAASQQVQGRPTHYMTAGRHLLGLPPDTMMFL